MPESEAFAIATQQAHATGNTPKGFGTAAGKHEAKEKYDKPKSEYVKTPNPSHAGKTKSSGVSLATLKGFSDELQKIAGLGDPIKPSLKAGSLFSKPKMTARPTIKEADPPAPMTDQFRSARAIQPPPVTATAPGN